MTLTDAFLACADGNQGVALLLGAILGFGLGVFVTAFATFWLRGDRPGTHT